MSWDNRIFNVNGNNLSMLKIALQLAFEQSGMKTTKAYVVDPKKGMVLLWHDANGIAFPSPLDAEAATVIVWNWLKSNPEIECTNWDADDDNDGGNSKGWRVYCEDWGHVTIGEKHSAHAASRYAIVAVKPVFLWHNK